MCSTPRSSSKVRGTRRVTVSNMFHASYSQMMRAASEQYEQRQKEREARQQRLLESEDIDIKAN